jgi:hypothetical protein
MKINPMIKDLGVELEVETDNLPLMRCYIYYG